MNTKTEKLLQLATMVLADDVVWVPTLGSLRVYCFSQTADNQESVFERTVQLWNDEDVVSVAIIDDCENSNQGYPGATNWTRRLRDHGIPRDSIKRIPLHTHLQTLSEAVAVVNYAEQACWDDLVIIASPFHQLRAFMSIITAVTTRPDPKKWLRVYGSVGTPLRWAETATHSQGTQKDTREGLIATEFQKISLYQAGGNPFPLISTDKTLEYFHWREEQ